MADVDEIASLRQQLAATRGALRRSEMRNRLSLEDLAQAVWETASAGAVTTDSPSWRAYTGQTEEEMLGFGWLDAVHPDDRAYAERQWREAVAEGRGADAEFRVSAPGGGWRWTNDRAVPMRDERGEIAGWIGVNIDIDARKHAETALEESEERQATLLQLSDALRPLMDLTQIQAAAGRVLGEHLRANRAFYVEDEDGEWEVVTITTLFERDVTAPLAGRHSIDTIGRWILAEFSAGRRVVVRDVRTDDRYEHAQRTASEAMNILAAVGIPIVKGGELVAVLVIHSAVPRDWKDHELDLIAEAADRICTAMERSRAERALRESEELRRVALDSGGMGAWTWDTRERCVRADAEFQALWGVSLGNQPHPVSTYGDRMDLAGAASLEAVMTTTIAAGQEFEDQVQVTRGSQAGRWVQWRGRAEEGRPWIINGVTFDVTAQREMSERQQVLVAELQHRTRNIMAVVRSMADKTARASADLPDFRERFRERLDALARVQGLLSRLHEHDRVTFDELIETELAAMGNGTSGVRLTGPKGVRLRSSMVQTLAMALHELATNAVKYGALGQAGGQLEVTWGMRKEDDDEPRLHIDWRERGVEMPPAGSQLSGGGHGRELIEKALPYQLRAQTTYQLGADGVHCTITIPVSTTPVLGADNV